MDFEVTYTEAQQSFRREVRAWLEANVPPGITRTPVDDADSLKRYQELRAFGRKLRSGNTFGNGVQRRLSR